MQANGTLNLDNMNAMNVDPTQYMAPMDLYESIWGGMSLFHPFCFSYLLGSAILTRRRITGPVEHRSGLVEL
jgi:hypothetical protein